MLTQLISLVSDYAGETIINNPAIPNAHNDSAITDVATQIFSGLQRHATSGNLGNIVSLFQQGGGSELANNPIVGNLISAVAGSLTSKYGVAGNAAQGIASSLLPTVMNQFINKTNDPNDSSFDLSTVLKTASGNNALDINGLLGQFSNVGNNLHGSLGDIASGLFGNKF